MIALSIRQPWAWHILHNGKDIENRSWPTRFRGRVLIHASQGCTRAEYESGRNPLRPAGDLEIYPPPLSLMDRGGIVGSVEIVDCVSESHSPWFIGPFGFVLSDPQVLPFVPWKGRLGFFDVPDDQLNLRPVVEV